MQASNLCFATPQVWSCTAKLKEKIDRYMPMIIVQNLRDFGWKLFSASSYFTHASLPVREPIGYNLDVFLSSIALGKISKCRRYVPILW
jgi:hypothetical protein